MEHSDPTIRIRRGGSSSDKSYSGDNRLVVPKRPERRHSSAPRCRLNLSWGWRSSQGFGCSPIKKLRELGSDRLESKFSVLNNLNPQGLNLRFVRKQFQTVIQNLLENNHITAVLIHFRIKVDYIGEILLLMREDNTEGMEFISARRDCTSATLFIR